MQPTREEILNEPAGPRLNAWVAEYIFNHVVEWRNISKFKSSPRIIPYTIMKMTEWRTPNYSQNIAHAWEVVEKMKEDGWNFELSDNHHEGEWCVLFEIHMVNNHLDCGDTPSLAICRAALLAKLDKE